MGPPELLLLHNVRYVAAFVIRRRLASRCCSPMLSPDTTEPRTECVRVVDSSEHVCRVNRMTALLRADNIRRIFPGDLDVIWGLFAEMQTPFVLHSC